MRFLRRLATALAMLCLSAWVAQADTPSIPMTGAWVKIGTSGATVDFQNTSAADIKFLLSAITPTGFNGQDLPPNDHRCWTLPSDLYALGQSSQQVFVQTTSCGGGAGGSSSGGANPAQDGTDGTGVTPPAGAVGIRGWLSGIYKALTGTLTVNQAGSTGTDYSATPSAVPVAGDVLVATVPATATRAFVEVQNQSAGAVQVVRDDGAGNNQTTILLAAGSGAGTQGGGWSSATFKGRVRVYAATSTAQVAAYQD